MSGRLRSVRSRRRDPEAERPVFDVDDITFASDDDSAWTAPPFELLEMMMRLDGRPPASDDIKEGKKRRKVAAKRSTNHRRSVVTLIEAFDVTTAVAERALERHDWNEDAAAVELLDEANRKEPNQKSESKPTAPASVQTAAISSSSSRPTCPVCLEEYARVGNARLVVLEDCKHGLCISCADRMAAESTRKAGAFETAFPCPICRANVERYSVVLM